MTIRPLLFSLLTACAAANATPVETRDATTLNRLLGEWDAMAPGAPRDELAARIDRVAGQRYATASRMFWFTDIEAAKAEAKRTNKPILSLRMLGRLDEELSCANSRYFRIALYANTELSKWLRDHFVLHWSSERPVPKITIDFGDGRKLERTITGNSIHYVLDATGKPLDALPGLYAPAVFKSELEASLAMIAKLDAKPAKDRNYWLGELHRLAIAARYEQWKKIGKVTAPIAGEGFRPEAYAQFRTVTKSGYEAPSYRIVDLGVNVGKLPEDAGAWAQVGLRLLPKPPADAKEISDKTALYTGRVVRMRTDYTGGPPGTGIELEAPTIVPVGEIIDASSKALLASLEPQLWSEKPTKANANQFANLVNRFERDILADTAINEFDLRLQIHGFFSNSPTMSFEQLNTWVYNGVFSTPKTDPWLGLAPSGVLALPRDGLR